jgi:hypothetical protein
MAIVDPGEGHWGIRTKFDTSGTIPCVTINDIYSQHASKCFPFIAKIDIEGGEADLFSANTEWVGQTPIMAVEPHDWLIPGRAISRDLLTCLSRHDRDTLLIGEDIWSTANTF